MLRNAVTTLLLTATALTSAAQTLQPDSIEQYKGNVTKRVNLMHLKSHDDILTTDSLIANDSIFKVQLSPIGNFHDNGASFIDPLSGNVQIKLSETGSPELNMPGIIYNGKYMSVMGNVGVMKYPGLMTIATGSLGVSFRYGNSGFYIGGIVNQYAFHRGLTRQIGIEGRFTTRLSSPLSFTAYATYFGKNPMPLMPDGSYMPPSMLGYYGVNCVGGYVNYSASGHFGMLVGGQAIQRHGPRTHYEIEPIATPYFSIGHGKKKVVIGLPVGQILNGLLRH